MEIAEPTQSSDPISEPRTFYEHRPLTSTRHIRLLHLLPVLQPDEPLECRLRQEDLADLVASYEAVSYIWGVPDFCCRLRCADDHSELKITKNVDTMLRRFRDEYRTRILWVDALCINQQDDNEKSIQVPLMNQIYRFASKVLAWIGEGGIEEEAIPLVQKISRNRPPEHEVLSPLQIEFNRVESVAGHSVQAVLDNFTHRPWFHRRWIIQEVALNAEVFLHYGQHQISWFRFMSTLECITSNSLFGVQLQDIGPTKTLFGLWKFWSLMTTSRTNIGEPSFTPDYYPAFLTNKIFLNKSLAIELVLSGGHLLHLLTAFDDFECSDPKDRIYALSALAGIPLRSQLKTPIPPHQTDHWHGGYLLQNIPFSVDYSLNLAQCYTSFAASAISRGHKTWVLSQACERRSEYGSNELPSWVPDWQTTSKASSLLDYEHKIVPVRIEDQTLTIQIQAVALDLLSGHSSREHRPAPVYAATVMAKMTLPYGADYLLRAFLHRSLSPFQQDHFMFYFLCFEMADSRMNLSVSMEQGFSQSITNELAKKPAPFLFLTKPFLYEYYHFLILNTPISGLCFLGTSWCEVEDGDQIVGVPGHGVGDIFAIILRPVSRPSIDGNQLPSYRLLGTAALRAIIYSTEKKYAGGWRGLLQYNYRLKGFRSGIQKLITLALV